MATKDEDTKLSVRSLARHLQITINVCLPCTGRRKVCPHSACPIARKSQRAAQSLTTGTAEMLLWWADAERQAPLLGDLKPEWSRQTERLKEKQRCRELKWRRSHSRSVSGGHLLPALEKAEQHLACLPLLTKEVMQEGACRWLRKWCRQGRC